MDLMTESLLLLGLLVWTILLFLFGRWKDIVFRAKIKRQFTKQEWVIVNVRNKDARSVLQYLVRTKFGEIQIGEYTWIMEDYFLYRVDKRENGTKVTKDMIVFVEGVPTITVDFDSITPVQYADDTPRSMIKPEHLSHINAALVDSEIALRLHQKDNLKLLIILCLLGIFIVLAISAMGVMQDNSNYNTLLPLVNKTSNAIQTIPISGAKTFGGP